MNLGLGRGDEVIVAKSYDAFLESKLDSIHEHGIAAKHINSQLFEFQRFIVKWACRIGRAAIFADCGLGKTPVQLEWARQMTRDGGRALIIAPLAVSAQTHKEGDKFGIPVTVARSADELGQISVTNYEMLQHFEGVDFRAVVLDESSILKNFAGTYRSYITDFCSRIPYRLACTATPAPNDYVEVGTHAEFLGVLSRVTMLARYFVNDSSDTGTWRLKGHAEQAFWEWMRTWCIALRKPSDIGYDDDGFVLPKLHIHEHCVDAEPSEGMLFDVGSKSLAGRRDARKASLNERVEMAAKIANRRGKHLLWCNLNAESTALTAAVNGAAEVAGSHDRETKVERMLGFSNGKIRALVTKPSVAGFGMNWQHCHEVIFVGLSDSWEQYYQAIRRCWRFGQQHPVNVHIIISDSEGDVLANIRRKDAQASAMFDRLVEAIAGATRAQAPAETQMEIPKWLVTETL